MFELIKDIMFWVIVITLFNIILRIIFNKSYLMHKPFITKGREEGYLQGYNDASMNILLYYFVLSFQHQYYHHYIPMPIRIHQV